MKKIKFNILSLAALSLSTLSLDAYALDQIIRPYQSARSGAMGGLRMTTGLYDENFFSNPARVTANPKFRFSIADAMIEGNSNLPGTVSKLTGEGDVIQKIANTAGDNNHGRVQTAFPAFYVPTGETGKWAFAFGILSSTQFDVDLRQSFQVAPQVLTDIGPALTIGRKFMAEDRLSVGITSHLTYRLASDQAFSFVDLLSGRSLSPLQTGGQGSMIDFDLGSTYRLPFGEGSPFRYSVSAVMNNVLGGRYDNLKIDLVKSIVLLPPEQPRTLSLGFSVRRQNWWKFTDTVLALEVNDMGNNRFGSMFRTVHIGGETHWKLFALRAGLNQGYWAAGLGIDLRFVTLDLSTYGEEMSLNPGGLQDRRFAIKFALQI